MNIHSQHSIGSQVRRGEGREGKSARGREDCGDLKLTRDLACIHKFTWDSCSQHHELQ